MSDSAKNLFFTSFETRRVPIEWEHPTFYHPGSTFIPPGTYCQQLGERYDGDEDLEDLIDLFTDDELREIASRGVEITPEVLIADIYASSGDEFMPDFEADGYTGDWGVAAYHSEGDPASPVFPDSPQGWFQMLSYCAENVPVFGGNKEPSVEAWAAMLLGAAVVFSIEDDKLHVVAGGSKDH